MKKMQKLLYLTIIILTIKAQEDENPENPETPEITQEGETPETSNTDCSMGCIKCSSLGTCLICDFQKNYLLIEGQCAIKTIENCQKLDNEKCLSCNNHHLLDEGNCIEIPTDLIIENCLIYEEGEFLVCKFCDKGFVVKEGNCREVGTLIEGCVEYTPDGVYCLKCEGKVPNLDFKSCDEIPKSFDNCAKFSFIQCLGCKDGYMLDDNYYLNDLRNNGIDLNFDILSELFSSQTILKSMRCRKNQIDNCSIYDSLYSCKECNNFHYLTPDKICKQYPEKRIENCEEYKTNSICSLCFQGYYKNSDNCSEVVKISQCKIYSQFEESRCLECDSSYFLDNNECIIRIISKNIANCNKTFINLDLCEECNPTFSVNLDFSKCLTAVTNCKTHTPSSDSLTCKECISGYYLNGEECQKGILVGCNIYSDGENCSLCKDSYYLDSNKQCVKHQLFDFISCLKFSLTLQNLCEECLSSRIKYNYSNHCLKVETKIPNCSQYSSANTCEVCDSKISYLNQNKCEVGDISKCMEYSSNKNKCLNCTIDELNGYGYITTDEEENNKCTLNNPNIYEKCQEIETDNEKKCKSCVNGYYPSIFISNEIQYCFPTDYYKFQEGAKINNCMVYDAETDSCRFCKSKNNGEYYVIYNGDCLDNCPSGFSIQSFEMDNFRIKNKFICKEDLNFTDSNFTNLNDFFCKRYDINKEDGKLNCASCSSDAIAVYDFDNQEKKYLRYSYLLTTSIFSFYSSFNRIAPIKSCVSKNIKEETSQSGTKVLPSIYLEEGKAPSIANCRFLGFNQEVSSYYCITCDHGYTGRVVKSSGQKNYLIEKCEIMPDCKRDVWINGLGGLTSQLNDEFPNPLDLFVSCHKCGEDSPENPVIPTYGLSSETIVEPVPNIEKNRIGNYGIPDSTANFEIPYLMDVSKHTTQTTCQPPGLTVSGSFITNCAVQEIDITKSIGKYVNEVIVNETNPICVSCRPKYKPTMSAVKTKGIDLCTLIEFCNSSQEFNRCEKCESGYAILKGSNGQSCVETTINNCIEFDGVGNVCVRCSKGNFLNVDGHCDIIDTYACRSFGYYKNPTSDDEALDYNIEGIGCLNCDENNVLSTINVPVQICVSNPHMYLTHSSHKTEDATDATISFFIKFCKFYEMDSNGKLICNKCKDEYFLQKDNKSCFPMIKIPNCIKAEIGGNSCHMCEEKYYFDSNTSSCILGTISNCLEYTDKENCFLCEENYFTTNIEGNKTQCFLDTDLNCLNLDKVKSLQGDLKCLICKQDYFPVQDKSLGSFPLKQCIKIPSIENCIKYSKDDNVLKSTLACIECKSEYFVDEETNNCVTRSFTVSNCQTLSPNEDNCKTCNKGYYLTSSKTTCKINPIGTPGCIEFINAQTCSKCGIDKYLKNNKCLDVPEKDFIRNCKYYKNALECQECNKNYYLNKNICEQSLATNCKTFQTNMKCLTCYDFYGLSTSEDIISCIQLVVPNCELPDEKSMGPTFKCLKCSKNYHLTGDKQCSEILNKINFCDYYDKDKKCSTCTVGYILSDSKEKCIALNFLDDYKDKNCNIYHHSYGCSACEQGFFKNATSHCVECESNGAWSGCFHCDANDNEKCLACETGWTHGKNGKCSGGTARNGTNTTDVGDEGVLEATEVFVSFVLVFMVFLM